MSGRLKQATSVLLHSIGPAAGFAGPLTGLRKSTDVVEKVRMLCGVLLSDRELFQFFQPQEGFLSYSIEPDASFFCFHAKYREYLL